jgi:hypothetical protein
MLGKLNLSKSRPRNIADIADGLQVSTLRSLNKYRNLLHGNANANAKKSKYSEILDSQTNALSFIALEILRIT